MIEPIEEQEVEIAIFNHEDRRMYLYETMKILDVSLLDYLDDVYSEILGRDPK